ncbi:MAG: hypothetical protein VYE28_07880 [Planctomycetota bacterium]|nr:hypothetical protein [Planctomycetota bacterium]MEE3033061.1 hypothetical protein [Planctomycetota bacterium]
MSSMVFWKKDKGDDLASRAVEQPQPPSSAFSPAPSTQSDVGSGYGGYQAGYGGYGENPNNQLSNASGTDIGAANGVQGSSQLPRQPYGSEANAEQSYGSMAAATPQNTYGNQATLNARSPYGTSSNAASPYVGPEAQTASSNSNAVNWPSTPANAAMGSGATTTIPNPYAASNMAPYGASSTNTMPAGYGTTQNSPPAATGATGATLTYPNTGMAPISPSTSPTPSRALPATLSQAQGSYTPGSTRPATPDTSGMSTPSVAEPVNPPTNTMPPATSGYPTGLPSSSGGAFQVPGGGGFPTSQPSPSLYR